MVWLRRRELGLARHAALDLRPSRFVDQGLVLALGLDAPFQRARPAGVEGVTEELAELLRAQLALVATPHSKGRHPGQRSRETLARGHQLEGEPHERSPLRVRDDHLLARFAPAVEVAERRQPRPTPAADGLLHAADDLLRPDLVLPLVGDRKPSLERPTRGAVRHGLGRSLDRDADRRQGPAEREVVEGIAGEAAEVIDD